MTRSITRRITTFGLAAVAAVAIGGTVSGAGDEARTCRSWHPYTDVSDGGHRHTWNPVDVPGGHRHTWNPVDVSDGGRQHTWNPVDVSGDGRRHTWNPVDVSDGGHQHTWNPDRHRSVACQSPVRVS
jgi:hypothetical protein